MNIPNRTSPLAETFDRLFSGPSLVSVNVDLTTPVPYRPSYHLYHGISPSTRSLATRSKSSVPSAVAVTYSASNGAGSNHDSALKRARARFSHVSHNSMTTWRRAVGWRGSSILYGIKLNKASNCQRHVRSMNSLKMP